MNGLARKRWMIWASLLGGAAWLALFDNEAPQDAAGGIARPVAPRRMEAGRPSDPSEARSEVVPWLALLPRDTLIRPSAAVPVDLFAARSWTPPPPPAVAATAPAPVAPPLPYTYAGKKQQDGQWEVYLLRGDMTHIVHQGSVLEDQYVVQKIEPPTMQFTYRPLEQQQTLIIGE